MIRPSGDGNRARGTALITGGAGFIGSHLADELLRHGYRVRALDDLSEQVHGKGRRRPAYLDEAVDLRVGSVLDRAAVDEALEGVDVVVHLAAKVGVGQSMYEPVAYTRTNNVGTAVLWEALAERPVDRVVVASSMSVYGEGLYEDRDGRRVEHAERTMEQLRSDRWDPADGKGHALEPRATPEDKPPTLSSLYALSKYDQERMSLIFGRAYDIPTVALRFFNVYGSRQALSNPYTGVLAIFSSRILNGNAPLIFEDGHQRRDFVHVHDVARACRLALERTDVRDRVFNVGSGEARSVREIAERLAGVLGSDVEPTVTGDYRVGDIRHCWADIGAAREALGYEPRVGFDDGLQELVAWLEGQTADDHVADATRELESRGLTV